MRISDQGEQQSRRESDMDDAAFQAYLQSSLNPLHAYLRIARTMQAIWLDQCAEEGRPVDQVAFADLAEKITFESRARALEMRGMTDCFAHIQSQGLEFLYYNDLAGTFWGYDGVAIQPNGRPVIYEAKATARPIAKSAGRYLRKTRHKGRQLGWEWCWSTLTECACLGASAYVFLALVRPMIEGRCDRRLLVSRCQWDGADWDSCEIRVFNEDELMPADREPFDFVKQRAWLKEIDRACPEERPRP